MRYDSFAGFNNNCAVHTHGLASIEDCAVLGCWAVKLIGCSFDFL